MPHLKSHPETVKPLAQIQGKDQKSKSKPNPTSLGKRRGKIKVPQKKESDKKGQKLTRLK